MLIQPLRSADISEVSAIHREALPRDVLAQLGVPFLERLYAAMIDSSLAFGFILRQADQIGGFVFGTLKTSEMFRRVVRRSGPVLLWRALPALIARPLLGVRLAQAFLYPHRVATVREQAELLVIAVRKDYRNGVGAAELVSSLNDEFRRRGVASYKLTVYENNARALRFYDRLGFEPRGSFTLFKRTWRIYTYKLNPESPPES